jgi:hypothetical protein
VGQKSANCVSHYNGLLRSWSMFTPIEEFSSHLVPWKLKLQAR